MAVTPSRSRLAVMALTRFVAGLAIVGGMLFLSAGTLHYWQAWMYLGVLFVPAACVVTWLIAQNPALLERRLRSREQRPQESWLMKVALVAYVFVFLIPGLDRRFGWSHVPASVVIAADIAFLVGYVLFVFVLRANSYASRVIEVEGGQQVVTTGPYAVVRHPMYVSNFLIFLSSPIALGSWWALLPALPLIPVLVARILDEERLLGDALPGYHAYTQATRFRLVPGVW